MPGLDGTALDRTRDHLAALAARLDEVRAAPEHWAELACAPEGAGATWRDRQQAARAAVLGALRYHHRPDDLPLLRFLLSAEVERAAADPFQGIGEPLETAALLVAHARDPRDLGLLARAKGASFDTACGLDVELLFSAGPDAALRALAALPPDECERAAGFMLGDDGRPVVDDSDLARWWEQRAGSVGPWTEAPPLAFLDLARAVGDPAWATALIDAHERASPRDRDALSSLAYHRRENGQRDAELALYREAAALPAEDGEGGFVAVRLLECLLEHGRFDEAHAASLAAAERVLADPWWNRINLGRTFVAACFAVARHLPPGAEAIAYLRGVHAMARQIERPHRGLLAAGEAAARHHQRARLAAWYARARRAETRLAARRRRA